MDAKEASLFLAVLTASVVVLIVIIFFTLTVIRQQRRNLVLYKEKLAAEINTLEAERKRMAEDLHDEMGPLLAGIKLKLNSLEELNPSDRDMMESVHENLTRLMKRMKEISNDLMPAHLVKRGLTAAIQQSADEINRTGKLNVRVTAASTLPAINEVMSLALYRITHEIMANTVKHSGAKNLEIGFHVESGHLIMEVQDDGEGFDHVAATRQGTGRGLRNMLNRTEMLGGSLYVDSAKEKGTNYRIEIPL